MKKMNFKWLFLLVGVGLLHSCVSDMDVVSEDDDVTSADQLYSTLQGYKQGLAGVYGNLSMTGTGGSDTSFLQGVDAGTSNFGRCLFYLQELTADEVIWSYENDAGTADLQRNIWTADNVILLGMFSRTMAEVALANEYMRQSAPSEVARRGFSGADAAAIAEFRNEARVLRAYAYYVMMDLFGKAPFVTESDPINYAGPEYNRQQLYDFVVSELTAVLPELKNARSNEYGRLDKAFAQMVLAKVYLNAEVYTGTPKWTEAAEMCSNIIAGGYTLESNYLDNFKADNDTSTEMIFTLQSDGQVTQQYGATTVIINGQVGSIESNGASLGIGGWGGALRVRKQLVQKFDGSAYNNDVRKSFGMGTSSKPRSIDIADISDRDQGYVLNKWSNVSSAGVPGPSTTFASTDFPLFRVVDAHLMYAEAALRGGGSTATALEYVNAIRSRSGAEPIVASQLTLPFILDERARELHWESHRRQDLIRFGRYTGGTYNWAWKGNAANGISIPAFRSVFPIPATSLDANTKLTQNTGY